MRLVITPGQTSLWRHNVDRIICADDILAGFVPNERIAAGQQHILWPHQPRDAVNRPALFFEEIGNGSFRPKDQAGRVARQSGECCELVPIDLIKALVMLVLLADIRLDDADKRLIGEAQVNVRLWD